MTRATQRAVESLLQELDQKVKGMPVSPVESTEIRAALAVGIPTLDQRCALEFALTDQARAIDRDQSGYYENVHDPLGVELGRKQLWDELGRLRG